MIFRRRTCLVAFLVPAAAAALLLAGLIVWSLRMPRNAPLARMYRTEVDLTVLVNAVEAYHGEHGVYPPAAAEGLRLATDRLSGQVDYLPEGIPCDAWGNPFHYVPARDYAQPGSGALRSQEGYFAPDTFQIYSGGGDGDAGIDAADPRRDNIHSWDSDKSWRATYHEYQRVFAEGRGDSGAN